MMRLMSPRNTAPYHTLECAPMVTSPRTTAVLARETPWPSFGFFRRNASSWIETFVFLSCTGQCCVQPAIQIKRGCFGIRSCRRRVRFPSKQALDPLPHGVQAGRAHVHEAVDGDELFLV